MLQKHVSLQKETKGKEKGEKENQLFETTHLRKLILR